MSSFLLNNVCNYACSANAQMKLNEATHVSIRCDVCDCCVIVYSTHKYTDICRFLYSQLNRIYMYSILASVQYPLLLLIRFAACVCVYEYQMCCHPCGPTTEIWFVKQHNDCVWSCVEIWNRSLSQKLILLHPLTYIYAHYKRVVRGNFFR